MLPPPRLRTANATRIMVYSASSFAGHAFGGAALCWDSSLDAEAGKCVLIGVPMQRC